MDALPSAAALAAELGGDAGRRTLLFPGAAPPQGGPPPLLLAVAAACAALHPRGRCFAWGAALALPGFGRSGRRLKHLVKKLRRVRGLLAVDARAAPGPAVFSLLARRLGFDLVVVAAPGAPPPAAALFSRVLVAPDDATPGLPHDESGVLVFYPPGRGGPRAPHVLRGVEPLPEEGPFQAAPFQQPAAPFPPAASLPPFSEEMPRRDTPPSRAFGGGRIPLQRAPLPPPPDWSVRAVAARNAATGFVPPPPEGASARLWSAFMGPEVPDRARFAPGAEIMNEMRRFKDAADPLARLYADKLAAHFPTSLDIPDWYRPSLSSAPPPAEPRREEARSEEARSYGGTGSASDLEMRLGDAAGTILPPKAATVARGVLPSLRGWLAPRASKPASAQPLRNERPAPKAGAAAKPARKKSRFVRAILLAGIILLVLHISYFVRKVAIAWKESRSGFAPWRAAKAVASAGAASAQTVRQLIRP